MFAINRTTIREHYSDENRIHDLKTDPEHLEFMNECEGFLEKNTFMPVTFDVGNCQDIYFSEYSYSDFSTGFWVRSLSGEFNSRYLMDLDKTSKTDYQIPFKEKYELTDAHADEKGDKTIVFLCGTNLFDSVSWELVDRVMYLDEKALIKPHPLTNDEGLKNLGNRYGWHRILGPKDSGYFWYNKSKNVYATANSELMVRSILDNKFIDSFTKIDRIHKASYFPFFTMKAAGYTGCEIKSVILNENSGFVFPDQSDWKDRMMKYLEKSFKFREQFKPHTPYYPVPMKAA